MLSNSTTNKKTKYYIMDAKYKLSDNVRKHEIPSLVFKYLFSISSLDNKPIGGMYIFCGKDKKNGVTKIYDVAGRNDILPDVKLLSTVGHDVDDNSYVEEIVGNIV